MSDSITDIQAPIYWSAVTPTGEVIHSGRMGVGEGLRTGQDRVNYHSDINSYIENLNTDPANAPPLPAEGAELHSDEVYAWGGPGECVVVRQAHIRTTDDPDTVPALFSVYREDYEGMDWIANEQVLLGDKRLFDSINYECLQLHTTQSNWTPPETPALWKLVSEGVQPLVQPTGAHDAYQIGDMVTHNGSTWESTVADNVWEPGVYGWVEVS